MDGILNVYKERGYTSHDVVAKLRGILRQRKIGHTGTLDPEAEGVLPVCVGNATKVCALLTDMDKCYEAVLLLGVTTDTQDIHGTVLKRQPSRVTREAFEAVLPAFRGLISQIPPMYSARKVQGKKLYELAREGKSVEREARPVTIQTLTASDYEYEEGSAFVQAVRLRVTCSKGTYVRTLCHDIGERLGCGGCMRELLRTRVGMFRLADSIRLSEAAALMQADNIGSRLLPVDTLFPSLARVCCLPEYERLLQNGNVLPMAAVTMADEGEKLRLVSGGEALQAIAGMSGLTASCVRVYDAQGRFCAIYRYEQQENRLYPVQMFPQRA